MQVFKFLLASGLGLLLSMPFAYAASLDLKEAAFSFRPQAASNFALALPTLTPKIDGSPDLQSQFRTYQTLDEQATLNVDLHQWSKGSGEAPQQFRIRLKAVNNGTEMSASTPVTITVQIKVGKYYSHSDTWTVDQNYLESTASWRPYLTFHGVFPPLAPTESYTYYSDAIPFGAYLLQLKQEFPVAMKARIHLNSGSDKVIMLPIHPAIFALEQLDQK